MGIFSTACGALEAPEARPAPAPSLLERLRGVAGTEEAAPPAQGGTAFAQALAANSGSLYGPGMAEHYPAASAGGGARMNDLVLAPLAGQSIDVGSAFRDAGLGASHRGSAVIGALDAATLGYGDELAGMPLRAAGAGARLLGYPEAGQQLTEAGQTATEAVRGVVGGSREAHPWASLGGSLVGGLALPVGRVKQGGLVGSGATCG